MHSRSENSYERVMNIARTWNPKNRSRLRRRENLPGTEKMRKDAAILWYVQVDAAARDEAEVDGGGGALKPGDARKTKQKGKKGKRKEMTLRSYL